MARSSRELARRPAVDPRDEPSVEWGWHGEFPRGKMIGGVVTIVALLAMLFVGHAADFTVAAWMLGSALFVAVGLAVDTRRRRRSWRS